MTRDDITHGMQVLGSDGALIGTVDGIESDSIKLQRSGSADGNHHFVALDQVERVDQHVHLNVTGTAARAGWVPAAGAAAAGAATGGAAHHPDAHRDDDRKGMGWLPWVIGGLILLGLILALRGCGDDDEARATLDQSAATTAGTTTAGAGPIDEDGAILTRDVEAYLAGNEATPRTFGFNNVFFDTGSAAIRPEDQRELASFAAVLARQPTMKAEIVGLADAQGNAAANAQLAADRANAVMAALVENGVPAAALTARSAGEGNTAGADQGSRRVDLTITAR